MPGIEACKINLKLTKIFSLKKKENNKKKIETIKNLNDNAANGLDDCTINCPLINAELQKKTKR